LISNFKIPSTFDSYSSKQFNIKLIQNPLIIHPDLKKKLCNIPIKKSFIACKSQLLQSFKYHNRKFLHFKRFFLMLVCLILMRKEKLEWDKWNEIRKWKIIEMLSFFPSSIFFIFFSDTQPIAIFSYFSSFHFLLHLNNGCIWS
jgi:hypothetical protein